MHKILFNADDLGLSRKVNTSIFSCHDNGTLNGTSLLVNGDDIEFAVSESKKRPNLDVALHINLSEGFPVSNSREVALLVDQNGKFKHGFGGLLIRSFLFFTKYKTKLEEQIEIEIRAQINKFVKLFPENTNLRVDTHIHTFAVPLVLNTLHKLSKEGLFQVIRIPKEKNYALRSLSINGVKQLVLLALTFNAQKRFSSKNIRLISSVAGVMYSGEMHNMKPKILERLISNSQSDEIVEVIYHPGGMSKEEVEKSTFRHFDFYLSPNRKKELEFLTSIKK